MKKIFIMLFICIFIVSCSNMDDNHNTLIVTGNVNTDIKSQITTYKIRTYNNKGAWSSVINYRTKIGTFEIGDTLLLVKKIKL